MDLPFDVYRDDEGRTWPNVAGGPCGPSDQQKIMLVAKHVGCGGCIFWEPSRGVEDQIGECHRRAPVVVRPPGPGGVDYPGPHFTFGVWSTTRAEYWCGEFVAAPIGGRVSCWPEDDEDEVDHFFPVATEDIPAGSAVELSSDCRSMWMWRPTDDIESPPEYVAVDAFAKGEMAHLDPETAEMRKLR